MINPETNADTVPSSGMSHKTGGRFFNAFVNGRNARKIKNGGDNAGTEIENVKVDGFAGVGIEQFSKAKDEPFNGAEQNCRDENGNNG